MEKNLNGHQQSTDEWIEDVVHVVHVHVVHVVHVVLMAEYYSAIRKE